MTLKETVARQKLELAELREQVARLSDATPAEKSAIVGYYILNTAGRDDLRDGTLHLTYADARRSLYEHFSPTEAAGFDVFECRKVGGES